jgi:hypothetical protein
VAVRGTSFFLLSCVAARAFVGAGGGKPGACEKHIQLFECEFDVSLLGLFCAVLFVRVAGFGASGE